MMKITPTAVVLVLVIAFFIWDFTSMHGLNSKLDKLHQSLEKAVVQIKSERQHDSIAAKQDSIMAKQIILLDSLRNLDRR
jgi:hypothetical protein